MADRKCVNCIHLEVCAICKPWPFDQGCDNYLELVRCKDCRFSIIAEDGRTLCDMHDPYDVNPRGDKNYFCADGERKDNG